MARFCICRNISGVFINSSNLFAVFLTSTFVLAQTFILIKAPTLVQISTLGSIFAPILGLPGRYIDNYLQKTIKLILEFFVKG